MADGRVVIDVELDDSQVRSDARTIETLLRGLGANAGDVMQSAFNHNAAQVRHDASQTASEVANTLGRPIDVHITMNTENIVHNARNAFNTVNRDADETKSKLEGLKAVFEGTFAANMLEGGIEYVKDGITELVKAGIDYNATQDKMKAVWLTLTGSASTGQQMVDMVNKFQKSSGYATETLDEMAQKIYHIKGSTQETQTMLSVFTTLGDAMGLSETRLTGVSEVFSRMMANGKATQIDINELTNAFPAFADNLSKTMNMPIGKIRELASKGKISTKVLEDTLINMQSKYSDATQNVMGTTQGLWRSMQSNWERLAGDFAKPIFDMKKSGFKDLADWLGSKQADNFFTNLGKDVAGFIGKVTDLVGWLNQHKDTIIKFGTAFAILAINIMTIKKVGGILGDINDVLLGLGRLRTGYQDTADASTRMANTTIANTDRMAVQSGESNLVQSASTEASVVGQGAATTESTTRVPMASRAGAVLRGGATLATVAGTGMAMFGDTTQKIIGTVLMFSGVILDVGKVLFNIGKVIFEFVGRIGKFLFDVGKDMVTFGKYLLGVGEIADLLTGPIGIAIDIVLLLGTAFTTAYEKIKPFHDWVNKTASSIKNGFIGAVNGVKNAFKPLIDTTVDWGNKVPKATQKALDAYLKLSDKASRALETLKVTNGVVTKQIAQDMESTYDKMAQKVIGNYQNLTSTATKQLGWMKTTNKKEYDAILKEVTTSDDKKIKETEAANAQIKKIIDNASSHHRALTEDEQKQINKLQNKMNANAVASMSTSQKEQEIILGKLKDHSEKLSADQAAAIVKNAKKQETETIKSADKTYKESVNSANKKFKESTSWADQEYYVNHSISKQQYEDIIKHATDTRDEAIGAAKKKHDDVTNKAQDEFNLTVSYAQQQAKGQINNVDWSTGTVLTSWDKFKEKLLGVWNDILGFFGLPKVKDPLADQSNSDPYKGISFSQLHQGGGHAVSALAHGTQGGGHAGGLAVVGDGVGSNAGPEAIITPDGKVSLSPSKPTLVNLPQGTSVLSATETRGMFGNIPHYANGIISNFVKWISSGPQALVKNAMNAVGIGGMFDGLSSMGSRFVDIGHSAISQVVTKAVDWVKNKWGNTFSSGSAPGGKVPGTVAQWIASAMQMTGTPANYMGALETIAMHESGGNPHAINLWDSNAKAGHPSKGLMQTIDGTFGKYAIPGLADIWNPIDNTVAAIRYMMSRYGSVSNVPGIVSLMHGGPYIGYANGTDSSVSGKVVVGENEPELIQTHDGRWVIANKATSFDDFMAGSSVTPLSQIKTLSNGVLAKAKSVLNSVGNPSASTPLVKASIANGQGSANVQVNIQPIVVQSVLDGKVIAETVTNVQNQNSVRTSRLRGQV